MTMVKSHEKKFQNYFRVTTSPLTRHSRVKCCRNVIFEEIDKPSTEKMMDFDYYEEYSRSISNKILLWQH